MTDPLNPVQSSDEPPAPERERVFVRRRSRRFVRRQWRRRILWGLGGLALLTAIQIAWAVLNMHGVIARLKSAEAAARAGDFVSARAYVDSAHGEATRANWGTWGPHFWLLQQVPYVGANIEALHTMSNATGTMTGAVSKDVFSLQEQLAPRRIRPVDSYINPQFFVAATSTAADLADRMAPVTRRVDGVATGGMFPGLRDKWDQFRRLVDEAGTSAQLTNNVVTMMPRLLATSGTRHYLVAFQNNAEFRSTGGIPGSFAELTVDAGHLTLGPKRTGVFLGISNPTALPLTAAETALFTDRLGSFPQDVTLTPDFARAGAILAAMYSHKVGYPIDGVMSVDPVVLAHVLNGTGPMTLSNGTTLNSTNAVQALLNLPYLSLASGDAQDEYFSTATHDVFDALVHGRGDAGVALKGVFDGIAEGRAMVWLAAPSEEQALLDSPVTKRLSTAVSRRPDVGVYLNDATGTKLEYYVDSTTRVVSDGCVKGQQVLTVTTTLTSQVPANLPRLPLLFGAPISENPGDLLITVYGYGPYGGTVTDTQLNGSRGAPNILTHDGHPVVVRTILLPRGGSATLIYSFHTARGETGEPILRATPTARSSGIGYVGKSAC